jgi:DNA repair exonuclease SbcCD ATPase subunit
VSLSDQGEIKDLRHKLRLLELECDKASAKQPELNQLKNSLRALEANRREEINDRDRRIAELEKKLQAETKRRELLESKDQDTRHLFEEETRNMRSTLQVKENLLKAAQDESCLTREKFRQLETNNTHHADELLEQLEHHRSLLDSVVQQYGILASQSASLVEYNRLKDENLVLQGIRYRLERKLSNSEGQVVELAHLIRQFKEQNVDLSQQLHDALAEINHLSRFVASWTHDKPYQDDLRTELMDIDVEFEEERQQLSDVIRNTEAVLSTYYHLKANQLYDISTRFAEGHSEALALAEQHQTDLASALASHEAIASRLESLQKERILDQEALHTLRGEIDELRSSSAALDVQLLDVRQQLEDSDSIHAATLKKEKDIVQRLTTAIQKSRMAEEALRSDIDW